MGVIRTLVKEKRMYMHRDVKVGYSIKTRDIEFNIAIMSEHVEITCHTFGTEIVEKMPRDEAACVLKRILQNAPIKSIIKQTPSKSGHRSIGGAYVLQDSRELQTKETR